METNNLKGVHHFYLGILLQLSGFVLVFSYKYSGIIFFILGLIITVDDFIQHFKGEDYTSPLHKLFTKYLYKYKIIRDIVKFFDNLFGKEY